MTSSLTAHHVGCLVESIQESLKTYTGLLGFSEVSQVFHVASQKVKVCFVRIGTDSFIELVEPEPDATGLQNMLKKRQNYYHVGYLTDTFDETLKDLEEKGARLMVTFHSEAFNNKRCAFLYTDELHMIEIIES